MGLAIHQVDAFTDEPFKGNPAAVCVLPGPEPGEWMQNVAREMNLAETAFLLRRDDGSFDLRWFTPTVEVDLCGHATLASAHILWETGQLPAQETARFHTRSGLLTAEQGADGLIWLDFPAEPDIPAEAPPELLSALGITPRYVGRNRMDYLVELPSEAAVRALKPDLNLLAQIPTRGVIVCSPALPGYERVSRFFAPAVGVPEDPVTGSAHCCLGPFYARQTGETKFKAYQASTRGGTVHIEVRGERVRLGGHAVTTLRGELLV